jgi:PIN domain nuclease of toxin-antitoxin system
LKPKRSIGRSSGRQICPPRAVALLEDGANPVLFGPVSCSELGWKSLLGKIDLLPRPVAELALLQGFDDRPITARHVTAAARPPAFHRDPWDRLLAAQAIAEGSGGGMMRPKEIC